MEIWCFQKVHQNNLSRICFVLERVRGCDVVACRGRTTLELHHWFDLNRLCRIQFLNIKYCDTFIQNEICAWVGRALALQSLWRLIALTVTGNTCLMKVSVCICIGFSEFNKPAMCKILHSHFFSIMFVLLFQTEHSLYFILITVCHFVGRLMHKCIICLQIKFYATI